MSQDLFAAFEDAPLKHVPNKNFDIPAGNGDTPQIWRTNNTHEWLAQPTLNDVRVHEAANATSGSIDNDEDDDFGDFEDASTAAVPNSHAGSVDDRERSVTQRAISEPQAGSRSFPPKAPTRPEPPPPKRDTKQESVGHHPFAGHMDLLFETTDNEYDAGADELADLSNNPEAAMAYSKRIIAEQEAAQMKKSEVRAGPTHVARSEGLNSTSRPKTKKESKPGPNKLRKKSGYAPPTRKADVLFDADNLSEHEDTIDEFGDFESWNEPERSNHQATKSPSVHQQHNMPAIDLLALNDSSEPAKAANGENNESGLRTMSPEHGKRAQTTVEAATTDPDDDAWDDFEAAEPSKPSNAVTSSSPAAAVSRARSQFHTTCSINSADSLPPTNIPPPVVILSVFPSLFSAADDALFDTIGKLDLKQRQMLLAHPASHQFLKGYLGHGTVLAHIIAGRKLRWKRDQHLSQSMRIGPSAAGGKAGMKLTGLDKSEVAKEDREVLDVVRLWKSQVGKLRSAVTAASSAPAMARLRAVPDISEQMPVKTLKQSEGGITAPHACALCGLKREERVAKADVEVEDSFREWWIPGMNMHVSCRKFWEEFEKKLKSR
ncbi:hypothetical protein LTR37_016902 [Vermiconidia calcicola]|uniref:Uncharacterized protein n=1 Tax=Vermiconidia calcicola TaxID=1690605 RepID=A0ACC3MLJ3_9PEZI|nr:hypothetical protein LTR37_016902 [Vermiconidia calcicola]